MISNLFKGQISFSLWPWGLLSDRDNRTLPPSQLLFKFFYKNQEEGSPASKPLLLSLLIPPRQTDPEQTGESSPPKICPSSWPYPGSPHPAAEFSSWVGSTSNSSVARCDLYRPSPPKTSAKGVSPSTLWSSSSSRSHILIQSLPTCRDHQPKALDKQDKPRSVEAAILFPQGLLGWGLSFKSRGPERGRRGRS